MLSLPAGMAPKSAVRGLFERIGDLAEPVPVSVREDLPARSGESGFLDVLSALGAAVTPPTALVADSPAAPGIAPDKALPEDPPDEEKRLVEGMSEAQSAAGNRLLRSRPLGAAVGVPTAGAEMIAAERALQDRTTARSQAGGATGGATGGGLIIPNPALPGAEGPLTDPEPEETPVNPPGLKAKGDADGSKDLRPVPPVGPDAVLPASKGTDRSGFARGVPRGDGVRGMPPADAEMPRPDAKAQTNVALPEGDDGDAEMSPGRPAPTSAGASRGASDPAPTPAEEPRRTTPTGEPARAAPPQVAGPVAPVSGDEDSPDTPADPSPGTVADTGRPIREPLATSLATPSPAATARAVARQIATAVQDTGGGSFEIRLNPEELGRLRIVLRPGDAGLAVSIVAERPETLDLLRRHADSLAQDFRDLGYESTAFSFGAGGGGRDQGFARQIAGADDALSGDPASTRESDPAIPARDTARGAPGRMDVRL